MSTELKHSDLNTLHDRLLEEIPPGSTVLDVGAGLATYHPRLIDRGCKLTLIDAHKPYLDERISRWPQIEIYEGDAGSLLTYFAINGPRVWDIALAIDFFEHIAPVPADRHISQLMKLVAKKVIAFVPEGNHPQDKDHYGMGGDHWQTHRSVWYAEDLEALGFQVERWLDFHQWAKDRGVDPGALWAVWRRP